MRQYKMNYDNINSKTHEYHILDTDTYHRFFIILHTIHLFFSLSRAFIRFIRIQFIRYKFVSYPNCIDASHISFYYFPQRRYVVRLFGLICATLSATISYHYQPFIQPSIHPFSREDKTFVICINVSVCVDCVYVCVNYKTVNQHL